MDLSEHPSSGAAQRWPWQRVRTYSSRGQKTARAGGVGARDELHGHDRGPPHRSWSSSASTKKSPAGRGRTGSLPCPGRRSGICGAPCSRCVDAVSSVPFLDDPAPQVVHKVFSQDSVRLPLRSRSSTFQHQVVVLLEVFKVFSRHGTFKRTAEQIADIPVPGGLGQDFRKFPPGGQAAPLPAFSQGEHFQVFFFFGTFSLTKESAKSAASPSPRVPPGRSAHDAGGL